MGYQGPQGARRAGVLGEGLLSVTAALAEPYRAGLAEGGHDAGVARMSGSVPGFVTDDPDRDWPVVASHLAYQLDSYRRYMVEGTDQPIPKPVDPEKVRARDLGTPLGGFLYGTPRSAAERITALTDGAPVETVFLWASIAGMPEPLVVQHVQTICTQLAPLLA